MRVYVSVDMEGIAGISHDRPTGRDDGGYPAAVALMVGEANAAIEGACAGGATEVVLNDSHGTMDNLTPIDLDPRAIVIQGQKPWSMVQGAGPATRPTGGDPFGVALFVGYHARAGHPSAVIAHTYSSGPTLTRLDGRPVGETGINAAVLGAWGVPVGLVAGDDQLAEEVAEWLPAARWPRDRLRRRCGTRPRGAPAARPAAARARRRSPAGQRARRPFGRGPARSTGGTTQRRASRPPA